MWKAVVPAALVAFVAYLCANVMNTLRPFKAKVPVSSNENCKLLDGPWGAEDLVLTKAKGDWVISSSLDGGRFHKRGIDACGTATTGQSGGLWAFRASANDDAIRLELNGLPDEVAQKCFNTHGLFLSDSTDRLYAVTHHGDYSSIEIFLVQYDDDDEDEDEDGPGGEEQRIPPLSLKWIRSVQSPLFYNMGLNDVVEGVTENELYVTRFISSGLPVRGRDNPATWLERFQQAMLIPSFLLGLRNTKVLRCSLNNDLTDCHEATRGKVSFRLANGITIANDRQTVFVNDVVDYTITVFRREEATGVLIRNATIELEHVVDNIAWKAAATTSDDKDANGGRGELWMGTVVDTGSAFQNEEMELEDRVRVQGGLAVAVQDHAGKWGPQRVVYNHDGTMLRQVSSAISASAKIVMGSHFAKGILVCDQE